MSPVVLWNHQMGWLVPGFPAGIDRGASATNAERHMSANRESRWPSYLFSAFRVHITSVSVNPPRRAVKAFFAVVCVTTVSPRSGEIGRRRSRLVATFDVMVTEQI